jgi:hypothetical protein
LRRFGRFILRRNLPVEKAVDERGEIWCETGDPVSDFLIDVNDAGLFAAGAEVESDHVVTGRRAVREVDPDIG